MIAVIANSADEEIVKEFFELFKTPWEFYRADRQYEVLLCAGEVDVRSTAKLIVSYGSRRLQSDEQNNVQIGVRRSCESILSYQGSQMPIYGDSLTFQREEKSLLTDVVSRECVACVTREGKKLVARIGYDLFNEIRTLLTVGQPAANADKPALELHIAFLRDLIVGCEIQLSEIPPVPDGYRFIACLTHDVDHPSIRKHRWDHTTLGFLYRAIFGSLRDLLRRRLSARDLVTNWMAALKLPFIHLGLAKDFWQDFDDRYLALEDGIHSTFFVIPCKDRSGKTADGPAPKFRAASYGAREVASSIQKLLTAGCEVGLHGIDAWIDESSGRGELGEIRRLTKAAEVGARMHWLYFDQQSPLVLEKAGASYDSTIGYNQTVGYRAGTTQIYKPLDTKRVLELPLHVMDTALFYPAYLGLSRREAREVLSRMADNAVRFGGCLTINWHDRSVSPERLWDATYRDLIQDLRSRGAWFATAGQAVAWFRKRRSVVFEAGCDEPDTIPAAAPAVDDREGLPGLRLRTYKARESFQNTTRDSEDYFDTAFGESVEAKASSAAIC